MADNAPIRAPKGLQGVVFDSTAISKAIPEKKSLIYRGYPVHELAKHCTFEEVAYLLLYEKLPQEAQLKEFSESEASQRKLSKGLVSALEQFPAARHPMDSVRTGVSFLGMEKDFSKTPDTPEKALSLIAKIPTLIAVSYRLKNGMGPISPDKNLSFSENFFHMCFGKVPDEEIVRAFDASLILYAEHGFNASSFTARVIVSSLSDMCAGVTGAIGSLKGPLHGGANEAVMHMLKEIGSPENARPWLLKQLEQKNKVMGFGHRLYRIGDSRVPAMKSYRDTLAKLTGDSTWIEISSALEEAMVSEKGIYPNLDFPAGPTYYMMGFEIELFTPIFVMARSSGWCAHILEQLSDNKLVRPLSEYTGEAEREVIPLADR
jgi:2-methylcitrate synthase